MLGRGEFQLVLYHMCCLRLWTTYQRLRGEPRSDSATPFASNAETPRADSSSLSLCSLAGAPLLTDRTYDGKDLAPVLFEGATAHHPYLFFSVGGESYGTCSIGAPISALCQHMDCMYLQLCVCVCVCVCVCGWVGGIMMHHRYSAGWQAVAEQSSTTISF